jgi:hypothetical protein
MNLLIVNNSMKTEGFKVFDGVGVIVVITPAKENKASIPHSLNQRRIPQQILRMSIDTLKAIYNMQIIINIIHLSTRIPAAFAK